MDIISTESVDLIPTSAFEHGKYPFESFNFLQSLCYPFYDQDVNQVIAAATSAGKTIVAELSIAKTIADGGKVVFLSPLKAVTSEKFDDWTDDSHFFSEKKVEIITGDHQLNESRKKRVQEADLILMTSEMLDTRTRYHASEGSSWLKEVRLLVVDEAHLLTTGRGPALEVGLMRFSQLNPEAKIILLSATMSNSSLIGEWLEKLNGKPTKVIASDWRPVDLHIHEIKSNWDMGEVMEALKILTGPNDEVAGHLLSTTEQIRKMAESRMRGGIDNKKTIVFVHTKSAGRDLERRLNAEGLSAEFHNADLDKAKRSKLEKKFRGDLDILIATSTLAYGVNMPARNCIIMGEQRGSAKVDPVDLKQMAGRAGRFGMYERGDVYLINCALKTNFTIVSQLDKTLPFHIVAEIANGSFTQTKGAIEWFSRSLCSRQHRKTPDRMIDDVFADLLKWKCIEHVEDGLHRVTPLGRIARDLYLDPEDIHNWDQNFKVIEKNDLWSNAGAVAWAIANKMKTVSLPYTPGPIKSLVMEFRQSFGSSMRLTNETYIAVTHYRLIRESYDTYMIGKVDAFIAPYLQTLLRDSGRIFAALGRISKLNNWDRERDMEVFKVRVVHGVGEHLMELVQIPGVGGTIATQLYKAGLKTLKDVVENKDKLGDYISRKGNVTRILNGLKELS